jgi:hypothetical protein
VSFGSCPFYQCCSRVVISYVVVIVAVVVAVIVAVVAASILVLNQNLNPVP